MTGNDVPLSTWPKAQPCRNPCGWTRFSTPALAASRLQSAAHVAVPQRLAPERAEQRVPAGEPESLPAFEPAVDGVGRVGGKRSGARLVALAVEHAEGAAGGVEVLREAAPAPPRRGAPSGRVRPGAPGCGCRSARAASRRRGAPPRRRGPGARRGIGGRVFASQLPDGPGADSVSLFIDFRHCMRCRTRPAPCPQEKRHSSARMTGSGYAPAHAARRMNSRSGWCAIVGAPATRGSQRPIVDRLPWARGCRRQPYFTRESEGRSTAPPPMPLVSSSVTAMRFWTSASRRSSGT